jgi:FADH2 O2-dependent halogenase
MNTRTGAVFGHFEGVAPFVAASSPEDPFCGDDAAQHHVLDDGWVWMLRFDHGVTSVGLVQPSSTPRSERTFWEVLERHPSLAELMQHAKLVAPLGQDSDKPTMGSVDRMSRCRARASGPGWVCLPVSYGFVDPLHSSGIAHSLSGVVRLAEALLSDRNDCYESIRTYGADLRREIQWLDLLVAGCYAAQPLFENFIAYACMYFVSAIEFEKQLAVDPGRWPKGFMQCHDSRWIPVVNQAYEFLVRSGQTHVRNESTLSQFPIQVRRWIEPWNRVGLLDPASANRISHSVAPKYASSIEGLCRSLAK